MFDFLAYSPKIAIISDTGAHYTYGQLQAAVDVLKPFFRKGELAFCLCTNTPACIMGYLALLESGVATVLVDARKNRDLLQGLLDIYHPNWVWGPIGAGFGEIFRQMEDYALYAYSSQQHRIHPDVALLLTTSGSTGSPKLVKLTAGNIRSNAEAIAQYLGIDASEKPVTTLPMYYSFGLSIINSHLLKGATILLTDKTIAQREFWDFMQEHKATSISGVPYTYEMLKRLHFFRMSLPHLKTMTQAGGKMPADLAREYIDFAAANGQRFFIMYGQTEATARMSYLPWEYARDKYASIGVAIPGGRFSLRDDHDREILAPDTEGELVFEGPGVCMGYAEGPEDLSRGDENHGILHTGDIARFDTDGFFYITGRMKRFVKIWGNRCNLDTVEQLVHTVTSHCACVGTDDKITVFVTENGLSGSIISLLAEKTGLNARAFEIRIVDAIPRNPSGKIQYADLQALL
ncbi:MAG: AMP-binding protein [Bacteroidales bacterium]|nr:AMP-binding protein [Bacteroidales bacterium]